MALVDDNKEQRKARAAADGGVAGGRKSDGAKGGRRRDVGTALRSIFHDTVSEGVPQSLQDLLSKLD